MPENTPNPTVDPMLPSRPAPGEDTPFMPKPKKPGNRPQDKPTRDGDDNA